MRRLSLAVFALATLGASQLVYAADMPVNMPVKAPAAIASDWTGFYAGLAGGAGWGRSEQTDTTPFTSRPYDIKGGVAGVTLGYNLQFSPVVFGIEGDFSYAAIKGYTIGTDPILGNCGDLHCGTDIKYLGTLRGRVGLAWQNFMPYVTGGLAYANVYGDEGSVPSGVFGSGSKWMTGWTIGGGIEARLGRNWSAKAEYLYVDLGNANVFTDNIFGAFFDQNLTVTAKIVRFGVNYRF